MGAYLSALRQRAEAGIDRIDLARVGQSRCMNTNTPAQRATQPRIPCAPHTPDVRRGPVSGARTLALVRYTITRADAPWWAFFAAIAIIFALVNTFFALFYMYAPRASIMSAASGILSMFRRRTGRSVRPTRTVSVPQDTIYANVIVSDRSLLRHPHLAHDHAGWCSRGFSRTFAVSLQQGRGGGTVDGVPTLIVSAANQRRATQFSMPKSPYRSSP